MIPDNKYWILKPIEEVDGGPNLNITYFLCLKISVPTPPLPPYRMYENPPFRTLETPLSGSEM